MTTRTEQRPLGDMTDPTILDDEAFWELAASWGFVRPAVIDPDQAWFWTREWITGEIEVEKAIAEGRMTFHASTEEFLAALEQAAADADAQRGEAVSGAIRSVDAEPAGGVPGSRRQVR